MFWVRFLVTSSQSDPHPVAVAAAARRDGLKGPDIRELAGSLGWGEGGGGEGEGDMRTAPPRARDFKLVIATIYYAPNGTH